MCQHTHAQSCKTLWKPSYVHQVTPTRVCVFHLPIRAIQNCSRKRSVDTYTALDQDCVYRKQLSVMFNVRVCHLQFKVQNTHQNSIEVEQFQVQYVCFNTPANENV